MTEPTSTEPTSSTETVTVDGRRRRRERGRAAVTDAMIELVLEGRLPPTVEQLAERSGVSVASVFRYFDGLDDLRRAATAEYFQRYEALFDVPGIGEGPLAERIARLVDVRLGLYSAVGAMARLVRIRAHDDPAAAASLGRLRDTYIDQIRHHFDTELSALTAGARADLVDMVATLTSFEAWEQLHDHLQRTDDDIRRSWVQSLDRLITHG